MSRTASQPPPIPQEHRPPSSRQTLRRLFLTLFLRGRGSRGLRKDSAPKSLPTKLALTLAVYALVGLFMVMMLVRQPVFVVALYSHAMTFMFLGMFVAASAGEVLFNKQEADILMHRPVTPQTMLWAKIAVLLEVSLWLAGAFNLGGLVVGSLAPDGNYLFAPVHVVSTALEALFCTSCVVIVYQLCLRWFGRERLDGLMTMTQVFLAIAVVAGGQVVPRVLMRFGGQLNEADHSWWTCLLPPAWFAGFDAALAGRGSHNTWLLALLGVVATGAALWLAFGKLARDYGTGLQTLQETAPTRPARHGHRRWIELLVSAPPLRWWLRDSVSRASFTLTAAYLVRDRDVKLRIYPGVAPMLVMPLIFLIQDPSRGANGSGPGGFGVAFASVYLGIVPMLALNLLQYSQQWQAADLFRAAPLAGPGRLAHGARRAVLCLLTLPMLGLFALGVWVLKADTSQLPLLLPGLISLPVYSLLPSLSGKAILLSQPTEEARSARRGMTMVAVMLISMALGGVAAWSWSQGWFRWLLLAESVVAIGLYIGMRSVVSRSRWPSME